MKSTNRRGFNHSHKITFNDSILVEDSHYSSSSTRINTEMFMSNKHENEQWAGIADGIESPNLENVKLI